MILHNSVLSKFKSNRFYLLLLFFTSLTETANVNPKELYRSVMFRFGHALATAKFHRQSVKCSTTSNELF